MVLKLYTDPISTNGKRVAVILQEKEVPYELHEVSFFKGEHKAPGFVEKQPFGQLPYIDDDGFILYESRAIAHYIATKYPDQGTKNLVPTEPKANALFHQGVYSEITNFDTIASKAVFEKLFKPYLGLTTDEAVFDQLISQLDEKVKVFNQILGKQKYIAGDELTLADLYFLPYGSLLSATGYKGFEENPNVARWFANISSRKSWQAVKDGIKTSP